ncbi:hypothetical protein [Streptomyces sp. I05A-00742]|uniref:hypothetical protein n=1 Tax=Streptomyces sp. I05A-00742 TaxID=2732853 RepID=UPI0014898E04|nr:hypothetical protein [Streptomyces sp. I05A-00742]
MVHYRPYRNTAAGDGKDLARHTSVITFTLMLTTPAVLTAALLRPRSGTGGRRGR